MNSIFDALKYALPTWLNLDLEIYYRKTAAAANFILQRRSNRTLSSILTYDDSAALALESSLIIPASYGTSEFFRLS